MSPVSVALPAPPYEVTLRYQWPAVTASPQRFPTTAGFTPDRFWQGIPPIGHGLLTSAALTASESGVGWGGDGAGGQDHDFWVWLGRPCMRFNRTSGGANLGDATQFMFPNWMPAYDPAALAPGFQGFPDSAVGIFDFHVAMESAVNPTWVNDSSPIQFIPNADLTASRCTPGYAAAFGAPSNCGGFGLFINSTGGGPEWNYVAWDETFTVLERVPIVVNSLAEWNTFRVQIITARPGVPAQLDILVNGSALLTREFGSSVLNTPAQATAGLVAEEASIYSGGMSFRGQSEPIYMAIDAAFGRFTPSGSQIQGV